MSSQNLGHRRSSGVPQDSPENATTEANPLEMVTQYELMRMQNCKTSNFYSGETYPSIKPAVSRCNPNQTAVWFSDALESNGCARLFDMKQDDLMSVWNASPNKEALSCYGAGTKINTPEAVLFNQALAKSLDQARDIQRAKKQVKFVKPKNVLNKPDTANGPYVLNRQCLQNQLDMMPTVKRKLNPAETLNWLTCRSPVDPESPFIDTVPDAMISLDQAIGMERQKKRKHPRGIRRKHPYCKVICDLPSNKCTDYELQLYEINPRPQDEAFKLWQEEMETPINPEPKNYDELYSRLVGCFERDPNKTNELCAFYNMCCKKEDEPNSQGCGEHVPNGDGDFGKSDGDGGGGGGFGGGSGGDGNGDGNGDDGGDDGGGGGGGGGRGKKGGSVDGPYGRTKKKGDGKETTDDGEKTDQGKKKNGDDEEKQKEKGGNKEKGEKGKERKKHDGKNVGKKDQTGKKDEELRGQRDSKKSVDKDIFKDTDENEKGKKKKNSRDSNKDNGDKLKGFDSPTSLPDRDTSRSTKGETGHLNKSHRDLVPHNVPKVDSIDDIGDKRGSEKYKIPGSSGEKDQGKKTDKRTKRKKKHPSKGKKHGPAIPDKCPDCPCPICEFMKRRSREPDSPLIREMKRREKTRQLRDYYKEMCHREYLKNRCDEYPAPQHKCDPIVCDNSFYCSPKIAEHFDRLEAMQNLQKLLRRRKQRGDSKVNIVLECLKKRLCEQLIESISLACPK